MVNQVAVIGCGAWATIIANIIAQNGSQVMMWCHEESFVEDINVRRENKQYLEGINLHSSITATTSLEDVVSFSDTYVIGVASPFLGIVSSILTKINKPSTFLVLTKGIFDQEGFFLISEFLDDRIKESHYAILSGPNLALEIASGLPAASVVSSLHKETASLYQSLLSNDQFRVYLNYDMKGVELGGILKNCYAIGAAFVDSLELGDNVKSAYLTRALVEMQRIGVSFGAKKETFYGLSGMGDLITTCSGEKSRNYRFGKTFFETGSIDDAKNLLSISVIEGLRTLEFMYHRCQENKVEIPILSEIFDILYHQKPIQDAIKSLMLRPMILEC